MEVKRSSPSQEIIFLLRNLNVHQRDHKTQQQVPALSQFFAVNTRDISLELNIYSSRSRWPCFPRRRSAVLLRAWTIVSCVYLRCVGSGLCEKVISRSEQLCRFCVCVCVCVCVCLSVCDLETSAVRRPGPNLRWYATKSEKYVYSNKCGNIKFYNE